MAPVTVVDPTNVEAAVRGHSTDSVAVNIAAALANYNYTDAVVALSEAEGVDKQEAAGTLVELLRFLALKAHKNDVDEHHQLTAASPRIMDAWRTLLGCTQIYRDTCHRLTDPERLMIESPPPVALENNHAEMYRRSCKLYTTIFQQAPPSAWWPALMEALPEPPTRANMTVCVRMSTSPMRFAVPAAPEWQVAHLMAAIQGKQGIPPAHQRVLAGDTELHAEATLAEVGLGNGSEVRVEARRIAVQA